MAGSASRRHRAGAARFAGRADASASVPDALYGVSVRAAVAVPINNALSSAFDVSPVKRRYVERYVYPFVYLNHQQLRRYDIDPRKARRMAGEAAVRLAPGVAAYYTADGECSRSGEW